MKKYFVLDPSLSQISHAESVYHVNNGEIEMPAEVARDLVESGQLVLASESLVKAGDVVTKAQETDGKVQDPSVTNEAGNQDSGDNAGAGDETEPNGEEGA